MSFLGCIGEIMDGSGIVDIFATVYAPNSIPHMMSGKAYSRALRAHVLLEKALVLIILEAHEFESPKISVDEGINKILEHVDSVILDRFGML